MPFQKGKKKTGGRAKGTPNRITRVVIETLDKMNCDPIVGMAKIAMNSKARLELRGAMFSRLAQLQYPTLKAIEHTGAGGGPIETRNVDARERVLSRIAQMSEPGPAPKGSGGAD